MKRVLLSFAVATTMFAGVLHAQESKSATRLEGQHKYDRRFLSSHMKQTEESIVTAIQANSPGMQGTAIQTLRELEQIFPAYPFSSVLAPLKAKLIDENTDALIRRLAALALDGLHSDAGDAVILAAADSTKDPGLQLLCKALLMKSSAADWTKH